MTGSEKGHFEALSRFSSLCFLSADDRDVPPSIGV